ncbi:hypothetical protein [Undibacterium sp. TC9W]|uniref:hypothetical protein n=1 Tax=Undibacterium sp. TC9W TaxID=3413053 RepID=UPI003BF5F699
MQNPATIHLKDGRFAARQKIGESGNRLRSFFFHFLPRSKRQRHIRAVKIQNSSDINAAINQQQITQISSTCVLPFA